MNEIQSHRVSLAGLGSGAAMERFDVELQRVLANIADPNYKTEAVREIRLVVKIHPNERGDFATVAIDCDSKVPRRKPASGAFFLGIEGGEPVAYESHATQPELTDGAGEKIVNMRGRK